MLRRRVTNYALRCRNYATETTSNLRKAAFPIKNIISEPDSYQRSIDLRNVQLPNNKSVNDIVRQNEHVIELKKARQAYATERNKAVEEVKAILAKANKRDTLPEELRQRSANAKQKIASIEKELTASQHELDSLLECVPNLIEPEVMKIQGDYAVVRQNDKKVIPHDESRDHLTIGAKLNIVDISAASKICGTGNAFLVGKGALLEQALIQYALSKCSQEGFEIVSPPSLIRPEFVDACGFKPRDESTHIYRVEDEELCLAGTAEIPLASQLAEQKIHSLPKLHCGVMRSFRAEAASKGSDTRGLYRLHEFSKVEMFAWCEPEQSRELLQRLVSIQESIFKPLLEDDLDVPLRVINLAPNDLGAPAYQKFDIEAWMPGRGTWGEISSASNCLDFQSRRLHTLNSEGKFVHTLNATALAVPRIIVAILENGWDPQTKTVKIPKVLHPFLGTDRIQCT